MKPVILFILLACAGCDGAYANFLNSVPEPDQAAGPVHVVLGIDGLSEAAFGRAQAAGAFAGWRWARLLTVFPGTSDYAWTRTLRTGSLPSYEIEYFDPERNQLVHAGLEGVLEHPLHQGLGDPLPCWKRFDFLGNGDLWMLHGYQDPEAALPVTLSDMFDALELRSRRQQVILAYLINVDVIGHSQSIEHAVAALRYISRQIDAFEERHPGRFQFSILSDHGNTHQHTELVDPAVMLRDVGVDSVDWLAPAPRLEAVPIIHVRNNYVALHTHPNLREEVALRLSRHPQVDLAVAPLGTTSVDGRSALRFGVFQGGQRHAFVRTDQGDVLVEQAAEWQALGVDVGAAAGPVRLSDREAFERSLGGPWPDLFQRIDKAFTDPAARIPADVLVSLQDGLASYGFHLPGGFDAGAVHGFHGGLSRASTFSVVATQTGRALPEAVRTDDLVTLFPELFGQ